MKLYLIPIAIAMLGPAAFRRLCVETSDDFGRLKSNSPAAFRRLCVETGSGIVPPSEIIQPPSGGCVLKL